MAVISIGIYDAKAQLSNLVRAAERGDEVTITRHGEPVARLVAIETNHNHYPHEMAS